MLYPESLVDRKILLNKVSKIFFNNKKKILEQYAKNNNLPYVGIHIYFFEILQIYNERLKTTDDFDHSIRDFKSAAIKLKHDKFKYDLMLDFINLIESEVGKMQKRLEKINLKKELKRQIMIQKEKIKFKKQQEKQAKRSKKKAAKKLTKNTFCLNDKDYITLDDIDEIDKKDLTTFKFNNKIQCMVKDSLIQLLSYPSMGYDSQLNSVEYWTLSLNIPIDIKSAGKKLILNNLNIGNNNFKLKKSSRTIQVGREYKDIYTVSLNKNGPKDPKGIKSKNFGSGKIGSKCNTNKDCKNKNCVDNKCTRKTNINLGFEKTWIPQSIRSGGKRRIFKISPGN